MAKYAGLRERILADGIVRPGDLHEAPAASWDDLRLVHDRAYVDAVAAGHAAARDAAPHRLSVVAGNGRSVAAIGGRDDCAARTAAGRRRGGEPRGRHAPQLLPIAAKASASSTTSPSPRACCSAIATPDRIAIVDLDVHQGNGTPPSSPATRRCSRSRCTAKRIFRFARKPAISTCRSRMAPETTSICRCCGHHLDEVLNRHEPDFVFYLAGADPYEGDRLGRLKLTIEGLRSRDEIVFTACKRARLARCGVDERRLRERHRCHHHHPREYHSTLPRIGV